MELKTNKNETTAIWYTVTTSGEKSKLWTMSTTVCCVSLKKCGFSHVARRPSVVTRNPQKNSHTLSTIIAETLFFPFTIIIIPVCKLSNCDWYSCVIATKRVNIFISNIVIAEAKLLLKCKTEEKINHFETPTKSYNRKLRSQNEHPVKGFNFKYNNDNCTNSKFTFKNNENQLLPFAYINYIITLISHLAKI